MHNIITPAYAGEMNPLSLAVGQTLPRTGFSWHSPRRHDVFRSNIMMFLEDLRMDRVIKFYVLILTFNRLAWAQLNGSSEGRRCCREMTGRKKVFWKSPYWATALLFLLSRCYMKVKNRCSKGGTGTCYKPQAVNPLRSANNCSVIAENIVDEWGPWHTIHICTTNTQTYVGTLLKKPWQIPSYIAGPAAHKRSWQILILLTVASAI
jgi:hypothetical protein